jgi:hypothetical protein
VDVQLQFLTACREAKLLGRPGGNVDSIRDGGNVGYAPATINRRLAATSALFAFREIRDSQARNPVPRCRAARMQSGGERSGLLTHVGKPRARSSSRLRARPSMGIISACRQSYRRPMPARPAE